MNKIPDSIEQVHRDCIKQLKQIMNQQELTKIILEGKLIAIRSDLKHTKREYKNRVAMLDRLIKRESSK
jgi:hypothetical protein